MGTDREVTLTLKTIADVKQAATQLEQLKQIINKLAPDSQLALQFKNIFNKAEGYAEKAMTAINNNFKDKKDISNFSNAMNGLSKQYQQLIHSMGELDKSNLKNFLGEDTLRQLDEYKKRVIDAQTALDNFHYDKVNEKIQDLARPTKEVTNLYRRFAEAINENNFDKAREALDRLKYLQQDYKANAKDLNDVNDKNKIKADQLGHSLNVLRGILQYVSNAYNTYNNNVNVASREMEKFFNDALAPLLNDFNQLVPTLEQSNAALDEQSRVLQRSATESQRLGTELDQFKNRIAYFFGLNNAVRLFRRALSSAVTTVKELDKALTETAVVTNYTVSDMWGKIPEYTERANKLGVTIQDVAEASTLYYQQGLKVNEVNAVTTATLKMARIAGLDAADATDRMTNALRGFNMEITEMNADRVADVYSKLAAMSASNVDEISTAMTKVASLAHNANMDFETTSAFLAQIIETTRESAETAGTALKTVVARFSEVKELYSQGDLLGTDEEGEEIDVNKVSKALRTAGINLNEYLTGMKGLDDIFMELASKWDSLDQVQQRYIATMAAGSRQQSRFIAMMQDYKRTTELVTAAQNATGASQQQYEKTLDSLASKLNKLKNSWNAFITGVLNESVIKILVDGLRLIINLVNQITGILPGILGSFAKVFLAVKTFKIGRNLVNILFPSIATAIKTVSSKVTPIAAAESAKVGTVYGMGISKGLSAKIMKASNLMQASFSNLLPDVGARMRQFELEMEGMNRAAMMSYDCFEDMVIVEGIYDAELQKSLPLLSAKQLALYKEANAHNNNTAAKILENEEQARENALRKGGIKSLLVQLGMKTEEIIANWKSVAAKAANIAAEEGEVVVKSKWNIVTTIQIALQKALNSAMLKGIAVVLIFVGVIYLIVKAFQAIKNNTPEKVMERLGEKSQEAADKAKEAYDSYHNLIDELDRLDDTYDSFEGLTKGTEAWNKKLKEVNDTVFALTEKFPELSKYLYYDKDGILRFDPKGQQEVTNKAKKEMVDTAEGSYKAKKTEVDTGIKYNRAYYLNKDMADTYDLDFQKFGRDLLAYAEEQGLKEVDAATYYKDWIKKNSLYDESRDQFYDLEDSTIASVGKDVNKYLEAVENKDYGGTDINLNSLAIEGKNYKESLVNSIFQYLNQYANENLDVEGRSDLADKYYDMFSKRTTEEQGLISRLINDKGIGLTPSDINKINENRQYYENLLQNFLKPGQFDFNLQNGSAGFNNQKFNMRYLSNTDAESQQWLKKLSGSNRGLMAEAKQSMFSIVDSFIKSFEGKLSDSDLNSIINSIYTVDTSSIDSIENLRTQFSLLGIEFDGPLNSALETLLQSLKKIGEATTIIDPSKYASLVDFVSQMNSKFDSNESLSTEEVTNLRKDYGATADDFIQIGEDQWVVNPASVATLKQKLEEAANRLLQNYIDTLERENTPENQESMAAVERTAGYNATYQQKLDDNYMVGAKTSLKNSEVTYDEISKENNKYTEAVTNNNKVLADSFIASANAASKLLPKFKTLTEAIKDNAEALKENDPEAVKNVVNALNDAFGTDLKIDDMTSELSQALINFANGEADAFDIITDAIIEQNADAFDTIGQNILDSTDGLNIEAENNFANLSDFIQGLDWDINGQAKLDNSDMIAALIENEEEAEILRQKLLEAGIAMDMKTIYENRSIGSFLDYDMNTGEWEEVEVYADVPVKTEVTFTNGLGQQSSVNRSGGGSKGKGGGGGSSKEEKPKYWDNPYDELYNLLEQQNEALRTREKLERQYDRLLKDRKATGKDLIKQSLDTIANLRKEIDIQEQIQAGRKRMINELGQQGYRDEEGNLRSFEDWGVTKYGSYNANTGLLQIDWEGIDAIEDPEVGGAIEAYISKLEELSSSFEETQETIEDMYDQIKEIKERNKQNYLEFEERVYQAIVDREQKVIDEYSALSDTISESNDKVLNSLQESIDMERQIRDNTKKEEEIADKEARLAYLQRDTSGANQMEILKLQQEIEDASEAYSDQLIDQAIDQMSKENEKAAQQREEQIEIMQAQLDWQSENGMFWKEVDTLISSAFNEDGSFNNNSKLAEVLGASEAFKGLSFFGRENWMTELAEAYASALEGKFNWEEQNLQDTYNSKDKTLTVNGANGKKSVWYNGEDWVDAKGNTYSGVTNGSYESMTPAKTKEPAPQNPPSNPAPQKEDKQLTDAVKKGVAGAIWRGQGWGNGDTRVKKLNEVFGNDNGIQALVDQYVGYYDSAEAAAQYSYDAMKKYNWKKYAKGGLVSSTGPAWLDGTKSNPEMVLSAQDTENFIALRNTLAQMLQNSQMNGGAKGGDNYFDIQINVDELANDYDVDQLAAKIKKQIYDDSTYRNVNAINYLR